MNLQKLFELQRQLDERIIREKGLEGKDLLPNKILALQVELGELANEWRGFKYWSNDQEPRTKAKCPECGGKGLIEIHDCWLEADIEDDCPHCNGRGFLDINPVLEEYVDCLHFVLSIGLDIGFKRDATYIVRSFDVVTQFNDMFKVVSDFYKIYTEFGKGCGLYDSYDDILCIFIGLGRELGFTWEQIEEAYMKKNAVNHQRQEMGY
jgi:dimeric dUTPase (all-alpha-NTP-PPase superfamily)